MQLTSITLAVTAAALSAAVLFAQDESDYQTWMKTIGATTAAMQKSIAAKDAPAVAADAKKLEDTFKQVQTFWEMRNAGDAVGFAKQAGSVAAMVAKDAAAGNLDQAASEAKNMGAACGGCHMAHREKADVGFKIK